MPERAVVAVVGDGGFMFSVNELATAVKYRLGIVFLVLNDERYGAIKYLQEAMFGGRWGETDLANPDFVALARAFRAEGRARRRVSTTSAPALTASPRPSGPDRPRAARWASSRRGRSDVVDSGSWPILRS